MEKKIRIAGIGGSLEPGSSSLIYLKYVLKELTLLGAEVTLYDIRKLALPMFNFSKGQKSLSLKIKKMLEEIHSADGYVFSSPEYHGTVSSSFKNTIDYFEFLSGYKPPYLTQKPAGCIAVAGADNTGAFTLATMVNIVHSLRGIAASNSIAIDSAYKHIGENGVITNPKIERKLKRLIDEIYYLSSKLKQH